MFIFFFNFLLPNSWVASFVLCFSSQHVHFFFFFLQLAILFFVAFEHPMMFQNEFNLRNKILEADEEKNKGEMLPIRCQVLHCGNTCGLNLWVWGGLRERGWKDLAIWRTLGCLHFRWGRDSKTCPKVAWGVVVESGEPLKNDFANSGRTRAQLRTTGKHSFQVPEFAVRVDLSAPKIGTMQQRHFEKVDLLYHATCRRGNKTVTTSDISECQNSGGC